MSYSAEHLLQLAVAFEVIGTGLAAKAATDLVSKNWDRFAAAFGRASDKLRLKKNFETFVCISGSPPVPTEGRAEEKVSVHDLKSLYENVLCIPKPDQPGRSGIILIRADYLLERINRLAGDVGQVVNPKWAPEYGRWSKSRADDQQLWDYADGGATIPF
uniref:hypothetical protein n=1 Tax=Parerythrobacter lutipelagi TaxID=1964208 RepID=UPI0010F92F16|nr:hypothetical protein [Parerythrobacter lutipelagi]